MKIEHLKQPEGVKDFFTAVAFVRNEPAYTERWEAMEALREQINLRLDAYGGINEIEALKAKHAAELKQLRVERETFEAERDAHRQAVESTTLAHRDERERLDAAANAITKERKAIEGLRATLDSDRQEFAEKCRVEKEQIAEMRRRAEAIDREVAARKARLEESLRTA